jgi:hypothetical protein
MASRGEVPAVKGEPVIWVNAPVVELMENAEMWPAELLPPATYRNRALGSTATADTVPDVVREPGCSVNAPVAESIAKVKTELEGSTEFGTP